VARFFFILDSFAHSFIHISYTLLVAVGFFLFYSDKKIYALVYFILRRFLSFSGHGCSNQDLGAKCFPKPGAFVA
jgi:hypothetical protein